MLNDLKKLNRADAHQTADYKPDRKSKPEFSIRWKFVLGGVLLVGIILIAYWWLFQSEQQNLPSSIADFLLLIINFPILL